MDEDRRAASPLRPVCVVPAHSQLTPPQPLPPHLGGGPVQQPPRLLDRVRGEIQARHYSPRTEKAYVAWIRKYIVFHGKRHPREMAEPEVRQFLSALATRGHVSASTQNQAFSALLFLYRLRGAPRNLYYV